MPDSSRSWRLFALVVVSLASACAVVSVLLLLEHGVVSNPATFWVVDLVCTVLYGVAAVLMLPRTRHPVAWIMLLVSVGSGLSALTTQYLQFAAVRPGIPAGSALWFGAYPLWFLGTYATLAVLPWLVSVGPLSRWTRGMAVFAAAAVISGALIRLTAAMEFPPYSNPYAIPAQLWQDLVITVRDWPDWVCVVIGALGLVRLVVLWWRSHGTGAAGFGWLAVGQLLLLVAMVATVVAARITSEVLVEVAGASLLAAQAFVPVALVVVVLGQRLWGVDAAVSRLAVWTLLTGVVVALYVAVVWLALRLLPIGDQAAGLLAALTLALIAHPARLELQRRVDRMVYGAHGDSASMLAALGEQLRQGRDASALPALVESLRTGLRLGSVRVDSHDDGLGVRAAGGALPSASADVVVLPLVVERRHVGDLSFAAPAGQRLDPRTVRVVRDLSGLVAVALELEQTNLRLQTASERLGEVRSEERRMLRRELHDSLGPVLAGVGLGLAASRRWLVTDPERADEMLAELEGEVAGRSDAVRQLARSLLPAQLDDGDLVAALEVLARRFAGPAMLVDVVADELVDVDTKQQVAVYYVAAEALLNAHRHSGCRRVVLTIAGGYGDEVVLEVTDDGRGIDPDAVRGIGLQSMRERADEVAGSLEVGPGPDGRGTRVRLVLP